MTIPTAQLPYVLPVTQNGVNSVSCTAENNVDYSTSANLDGQVKIDSQTPSVAYQWLEQAPAWVSGPLTITVTGKGADAAVGDRQRFLRARRWRLRQPPDRKTSRTSLWSSDGVHTVNCTASPAPA